jgi:hypothetical protein
MNDGENTLKGSPGTLSADNKVQDSQRESKWPTDNVHGTAWMWWNRRPISSGSGRQPTGSFLLVTLQIKVDLIVTGNEIRF